MHVLHKGTLYAGAVFLVLAVLFSKSLALYTTTSSDKCNNWFYSGVLGQDKWGTFCPTCKGDNQSPIDIQDHIALYAPNLDLLAMSGHDTPKDMQLVNYGRSVYLDLGQAGEYWLWNGNLPGRYLANQAHFHWGQDSSRGSDHTINGRQFPLEMHILYDLMDQVKSREMMAVLSVLFEVSDEDNPNLMPILNALPRVTTEGSETIITRFTISSLFPPNMKMFYRYYGGLTTPPCTESVVWTVYKRRVSVSERQLHIFRQYLTFNNNGRPAALVDNFRKTQPLNNRIIYSTENEAGVKAGGFAAIAIVMVILVFTVYAFVAFYLPRYRAAHMAKQEEKQPIIDE